MTSSPEELARRLGDVWFDMYHACIMHRPELADELDVLITGRADAPRPDTAMIRAFLSAVVRGSLAARLNRGLGGWARQ